MGQSSCTSRFLSPNLSEMCCKENFPEDTATCRAFARSPFSPRSRASASGLQPSSNCGFEHPKASFWALPLSQDPPKPPPRCSMGCKELSCCSSPRPSEGGSLWVFFFASQLPSKPPCRMQGEGGRGDRCDCPHDVDTKLKGVKTGKGWRRCGFLSQYRSRCRSPVVLGDNGNRMGWGRRPGGHRGVAAAATR